MRLSLKHTLIILFLSLDLQIFAQVSTTNMLLWLKADSGVTFDSFNKVQQWDDYSGVNNHFVQGSSVNMPLWKDSVFNDMPAILFNGTSTYLKSISKIDLTQGFTFFIVAKNNLRKNYNGLFRVASNLTDSTVLELGFEVGGTDLSSGTFNYVANRNFGLSYRQISNAPPAVNNIYLYEVEVRSDSLKIYVNNVLKLNILSNPSLIPSLILNGFLGVDYAFSSNLDGAIAELLLYKQTISSLNRSAIYQYLNEKYLGKLYLGADISSTFCPTIGPNKNFKTYLWSTGETTQSISVNQSGTYWVKAANEFDYFQYDTINVTIPIPTVPTSLIDTICEGESIKWNTGLSQSQFSFQWQDNSIDSSFTISQGGKYYVKITDASSCTFVSDTLNVLYSNFPSNATLGNDTSFCSGNTIALKNGTTKAKTYLWSDNSTADFLTIANSGTYSTIVTDSLGCIAYDTINVIISGIAPKANFSFSSLVCSGDSINFNNLSIPPGGNSIVSHLWNFGDSKTSTLDNPKHNYVSPDTGKFNVKLTVTTDAGCSKDTTIQLHVYPKPVVNFSSGLACSEKTAKFTNLSDLKGYTTLSSTWSFADASSGANNSSTLLNPNHVFTSSGNYAVKLITINNKGCIDSITKTIAVQPSPDAQFTSSLACEKQKVYFTDNSTIASPWVIQSYSTNFGDASAIATTKNPSHTYIIIGSYNVKYVVSANNGCSDTSIVSVNVNSKPFVKFGPTGSFCVNNMLTFKDSSIVNGSSINSWKWTFDNTLNSTLKNPFVSFSALGVHSAKLLVSSVAGCKDSTTKSFTINPLPTADFSFTPLYGDPPLTVDFTNLSSSGVVSFDWNFGDDSLSTLSAPSHVYQDSGNYQIQLYVTDNNGCVNSTTKNCIIQYAQYDIALLKVIAFVDVDNFLNVTLNFGNASSRPLTSADFIVDIEGESGFKEGWTGNLAIGGITSYTLKTSPRLTTTSTHNYICVTAKNPNSFTDIQPSNNKICEGLKTNEFILPEPNPNPVSENLHIPFIMPLDEEVEVTVFNKLGQKLNNSFNFFATKGYNEIVFNTSSLVEGVYTYTISYKDVSGTKKFVKRAN